MHRIKEWSKCLLVVLAIVLFITLIGCHSTSIEGDGETSDKGLSISKEDNVSKEIQIDQIPSDSDITKVEVKKGQNYSTKDEVAAYIHQFHELPPNYLTKIEAQKIGWDSSKGNLWDVTDKQSIGGDSFGNREGILPKTSGRKYYECDINYNGGYRGAERIVFSNDGLIFYTGDHYKTFEKLY